MIQPCGLPELLTAYVEGRLLPETDHAVTLHVGSCARCREEVIGIAEACDALRAGGVTQPLLSDECDMSATLRLPASMWWAVVRADAKLRTPRAVEQALAFADSAYHTLPSSRYLEICTFAAALADQVAVASPVPIPHLRAEAWKEKSTALRLSGSYVASLEALDVAHAAARECAVDPDYEAAKIAFARAIVLTEMDRVPEARAILERVRPLFAEVDFRRYSGTFWQEAITYFCIGDYDAAISIFESLIKETEEHGDDRSRSELFSNIARCFAQANQHWVACSYLKRSSEAARRCGNQLAELRNQWTIGLLLAKEQRYDEALEALESASRGYSNSGMTAEVVRVEVDLANTRLAADPSADLFETFRDLAAQTTGLHLTVRHAHVLQTLRELSAQRQVTHDVLMYTRVYLEDLETYPDMTFSPPVRPPELLS